MQVACDASPLILLRRDKPAAEFAGRFFRMPPLGDVDANAQHAHGLSSRTTLHPAACLHVAYCSVRQQKTIGGMIRRFFTHRLEQGVLDGGAILGVDAIQKYFETHIASPRQAEKLPVLIA